MTNELIKILSDFKNWIDDWTFRIVPTEEEFIDKLKNLDSRFHKEIKKQQLPIIKKK